MAVYNKDEYTTSMARNGTYMAGCNMFHLNLWYKPQGDVPVNGAAVEHLMTYFFKEPTCVFPLGLVVAAFDEEGITPCTKKGGLAHSEPHGAGGRPPLGCCPRHIRQAE